MRVRYSPEDVVLLLVRRREDGVVELYTPGAAARAGLGSLTPLRGRTDYVFVPKGGDMLVYCCSAGCGVLPLVGIVQTSAASNICSLFVQKGPKPLAETRTDITGRGRLLLALNAVPAILHVDASELTTMNLDTLAAATIVAGLLTQTHNPEKLFNIINKLEEQGPPTLNIELLEKLANQAWGKSGGRKLEVNVKLGDKTYTANVLPGPTLLALPGGNAATIMVGYVDPAAWSTWPTVSADSAWIHPILLRVYGSSSAARERVKELYKYVAALAKAAFSSLWPRVIGLVA